MTISIVGLVILAVAAVLLVLWYMKDGDTDSKLDELISAG